MSFDITFLKLSSRNPTPEEVEAALEYEEAASLEEQKTICQIAEDLLATDSGATWGWSQHGMSDGAWISGNQLPDISLSARSIFISSSPDPRDPAQLALYTSLLEFFEQRGYVCFDHQRGELIEAPFTFV